MFICIQDNLECYEQISIDLLVEVGQFSEEGFVLIFVALQIFFWILRRPGSLRLPLNLTYLFSPGGSFILDGALCPPVASRFPVFLSHAVTLFAVLHLVLCNQRLFDVCALVNLFIL